MPEQGPPLLRPVPRRPFSFNTATHFATPSPPHDDDGLAAQQEQAAQHEPWAESPAAADRPVPCFFEPTGTPAEMVSIISRPQSLLNSLTSSTLTGIFYQAAANRDRSLVDHDDTGIPWATGARTPVKRASIDDATYRLMRDRSHAPPGRRRSSCPSADRPSRSPASPANQLLLLFLRAALLFTLGAGYGLLVTHLQDEQGSLGDVPPPGQVTKPDPDVKCLIFWGFSGIFLGFLLPWFDKFWESGAGEEAYGEADDENEDGTDTADAFGLGTDWALVIRAVGALVGIIFAIRKLAWASTLQVSAALALVNPLLWWLIDRSKPGLLLSAGVGVAGSMLLSGVNPDMVPTPPSRQAMAGTGTGSGSGSAVTNASRADPRQAPTSLLGGLARQERLEAGVWMLSVLFCSCVCFGNIGRRLAWSRNAGGKGRCAGLR